MQNDLETCKNCNQKLNGKFCSHCGQKRNTGRIVLTESLKGIWEQFFDINTPVFHTIYGLLVKPGKTIHEYINGKRTAIYHPFKLFLLIFAFYYFIKILFDFNPIDTFNAAIGNQPLPSKMNMMREAGTFLSNHINHFLLFCVFFMSLSAKLFNWRSKIFFGEYITAALYIISIYLLLSTFSIALVVINPKFFLINYLIVFTYPVYVFYQLHDGKSSKTSRILGGFLMNIFAWVLYVISSFALSYLIVITFKS